MHAGPELSAALLVCTSLAVGAAMRVVAARLRVPYTIAILLSGAAVGAGLQWLSASGRQLPMLAEQLRAGAHISPDLIFFIFLPILIFESAFSIDVHAFRRNIGPVLLLAGPIMLLSTGLTALAALYIAPAHWQWSGLEALVFGALISATDPVAVVALLREMGAPKRLALLIEGESLLNDGTAIVVFGVLLGLLTGTLDFHVGGSLLHFAWVSLGGLIVGLVLGALVTTWLARTFNAPLVEITLTIVLAYGAMIFAETVLHVSGVIALVTAGLWMSSHGRLHISPEVSQFLHRFWEMLAYLANTLIFFLVGLVIALQLDAAGGIDLLRVFGLFLAVLGLRFVLVFAVRPLTRIVGSPVSAPEATVLAWGGLRGAVSLALALIASQHPAVPEGFGSELLLATAGVVLLTILLGGGMMGALLHRLGFDIPAATDRLANALTQRAALRDVERHVDDVSRSRDLRAVDWTEVHREIAMRTDALDAEIAATRREIDEAVGEEYQIGFWRQALNIERRGLWTAFAEGTLSAEAARVLDHEIDLQHDRLSQGAERPAEDRHPAPPRLRDFVSRSLDALLLLRGTRRFEQLVLRYDLYRAEQLMAERVLRELQVRADIDTEIREEMRDYYRHALHVAKERLEDLRVNLPEVTRAVETRLARRTQLNLERESYAALAKLGALDSRRSAEALAEVEQRMKALRTSDHRVPLPETGDLCRNAPLFAGLDEAGIELVAALTREKVFAPGEVLCREGERGDSMFIVARGAVKVLRNKRDHAIGESLELLDVLGGGDVLGEMALLTGASRNATAMASTTVTVGEISRRDFERLCAAEPDLYAGIWHGFGERRFDNCVRDLHGYEQLGHDERIAWYRRGRELQLGVGEAVEVNEGEGIFLVAGSLRTERGVSSAPRLLAASSFESARAAEPCRVVVLPPLFMPTDVEDGDPHAVHSAETDAHASDADLAG
jgi:Na+/H+ antiporter